MNSIKGDSITNNCLKTFALAFKALQTYRHMVCNVYAIPLLGVITPAVDFPTVVVDVEGPVIIIWKKSSLIYKN